MSLKLSQLYHYPLKSARGCALHAGKLNQQGLQHDRDWMVATPDGRFISGRSHPKMVLISAVASIEGLQLSAPGMPDLFVPNGAFGQAHAASVWKDSFSARRGSREADQWLSTFLDDQLVLMWIGPETSRRVRRFPDVPLGFADGYPLLLIGAESLEALNHQAGQQFAMARFRPNLVVTGSAPFMEDGWKSLKIGAIEFEVAKRCTRCVFTTVDPDTGEKSADQEPLRTLARFRKAEEGIVFGVNLLARSSGTLQVGMDIQIIE